jgi:hypothetical protein
MQPPALAVAARRRHAGWLAAASEQLGAYGGQEGPLGRAMLADLFATDGLLDCLAAREPQAAFLYLWSVDVAHSSGAADGGVLAAAGRVTAALQFVDAQVGRLVAACKPADRLVLLLDPGRQGDGPGLLALAGPGAAPARTGGTPMSALAVAPTLLWLAGLPPSVRMAASPRLDLLDAAAAPAHPPSLAVNYGPPPPPAAEGMVQDETGAREYLRSLGYIE